MSVSSCVKVFGLHCNHFGVEFEKEMTASDVGEERNFDYKHSKF